MYNIEQILIVPFVSLFRVSHTRASRDLSLYKVAEKVTMKQFCNETSLGQLLQ